MNEILKNRDIERCRETVRDLLKHIDDAAFAAFDGKVIDVPMKLAERAQWEVEQLK